jgi:hypothetical protein
MTYDAQSLTPRFSNFSATDFITSWAFFLSTKKLTLCGRCSVSGCIHANVQGIISSQPKE